MAYDSNMANPKPGARHNRNEGGVRHREPSPDVAELKEKLSMYEKLTARYRKDKEAQQVFEENLWKTLPEAQQVDFLQMKLSQKKKQLEDEKIALRQEERELKGVLNDITKIEHKVHLAEQKKEQDEKTTEGRSKKDTLERNGGGVIWDRGKQGKNEWPLPGDP
ncbi:hypothetical protein P280DRAFT_475166 [Massarina eburnea CBS 473.64]|uniref:Uncharacterized protein n=1 Tax=Massarina eburnea CBS 473.64 TaxID=1395130 RepID=A0A6A6SEB5_9PLEO|nr:hypothetical protein P280DRAFT_475166 [Massarina eburnea CBS 473.64]